jgi:hypothetical protein
LAPLIREDLLVQYGLCYLFVLWNQYLMLHQAAPLHLWDQCAQSYLLGLLRQYLMLDRLALYNRLSP